MKLFVLFLVAVLLLGAVRGDENDIVMEEDKNGPMGMKFAITQGGLAQLLPPMQAKVLASLRTMRFPDKSGKKGPCSFRMSGAHVTGASASAFQIRPLVGSAVELVIPSVTIRATVSHHFHCCKRIIFKFCKNFNGHSDITFSGRIVIVLDLGSAAGKFTLKTRYVDLSLLSLTVNTHSKHGGQIAHGIRRSILASLHGVAGRVKAQADAVAKQAMTKIPLMKKIDKFVELDMSPSDATMENKKKKKKKHDDDDPPVRPLPTPHPPLPGAPYLITRHKAEFYAIAGHHEAPFIASRLPDGGGEGMAQIFLGDFMLNSAGFAYYDAGVLKRTIVDKDIPASIPVRLNTKTFEEIFPNLYAKYPDMMMTIDVSAPKTPSASVVEGKIVESVFVDLGFNVVDRAAIKPVFTLSLAVDANVAVRAEGTAVKGHAEFVKMDVTVKETSIGAIDVEPCKPLFEMVVKDMVMPKLNAKLEKGAVIPVVHGIHFVRPRIAVKEGYIALQTDLELRASELGPFPFEVDQALEEDEESEAVGQIDEDGEEFTELEDNLAEEDVTQDVKNSERPACHLEECHEYFDWCTKAECNFLA